MHLPFNEGYLRTLQTAFPQDTIVFHARSGHIEALRAAFSPDARIEWKSIEPFAPALRQSRHHPIGGRVGAWRVWRQIRTVLREQTPKLTAILGFDANMLAVLRRVWPSTALLHLALHNHLAETAVWRSRNPVLRRFDFTNVLRRSLPPNIRILALELGIREALAAYAPELRDNIDVFEHPILEGEWGDCHLPAPGERLRVAFLGHASVGKGFDKFVAWANAYAGDTLEFHAIGIGSPEALGMDQSALARKATAGSVPRAEYVDALAHCHVACLPLPPSYQYVASGSVIDAIAGLKPIFCYSNVSVEEMAQQYGKFGVIATDIETLGRRLGSLTRDELVAEFPAWGEALRRMRAARQPASLGPSYRTMVEAAARRTAPAIARPSRLRRGSAHSPAVATVGA